MAIPSSGALTFSAIQTEFGGSNPIGLSEYYSAAANVAVSGAIKVSEFYGQSALTYSAIVKIYNPYHNPIGSANAWMKFATTGNVTGGATGVTEYTWLTGAGSSSSDYDIMFTKNAASAFSLLGVTNNAWKQMSTDTTAYLTDTIAGSFRQVYANVQIRANSSGTIMDSNTMYWYAWAESGTTM